MIIAIRGLKASTLLGAYAHERDAQRDVVLHLNVDYDHRAALASDQLGDAVDYAVIEETIVRSLAGQHYILLESLAEHVADLVMAFAGVKRVEVTIDKPGALVHSDMVSILHSKQR